MIHVSNLCITKHHKRLIARQIISAWLKCTETYVYLDRLVPDRALDFAHFKPCLGTLYSIYVSYYYYYSWYPSQYAVQLQYMQTDVMRSDMIEAL